MKENGSEVRRKVKDWLLHADDDLRLAKVAFKLKSAVPHKLIAYHAQQCAEKCLKAYLVYKSVDFPYTHDLTVLLNLLPDDVEWAGKLRGLEILRSYAITTRYPGEEKVTKKEALRAVSLAASIQKTITRALAQDGLKIPTRTKA